MYKKNVELLKKYNEEKTRLQSNLKICGKKVQDLEQNLHVPTVASEQPKASRQGKRDTTHFSSSQEEGL